MSTKLYRSTYHYNVALMEFGLYNWKQHSTGWLLKQLRSHYRGDPWYYEPDDWVDEYLEHIRAELAKRPHQSRKRERKAKRMGK